MPARLNVNLVREQILALLATLAEFDKADAPSSASSLAGPPGAPRVAHAAELALTDEQRHILIGVINVYETGSVGGDYGAISIYSDGPNGIRQVTYGRAQTTEYGNLRQLISDYVSAGGQYSAALAAYVGTIGTKTGNPPQSPLVDNQAFKDLLRKAGGDPVMRQTQDAFFDRVYLRPALNWAAVNGFTNALSALVIYDSYNHSGGILSSIRDAFAEKTPAAGGDEKAWITEYVAARQNWLATNPRAALHATVYRTQDLAREIARSNWDLAFVPIMANGTPVDGALVSASLTPSAAPVAGASGDDDPAAPNASDVSETTDFESGRVLTNLGSLSQMDTPPSASGAAAAVSGVTFNLARAQNFLHDCQTSIPRIRYGLGKKIPRLNAVPGRDFTKVDCSGFIREVVRLATTPMLNFPDGSVIQHDWVIDHGFAKSTIADAKNDDGLIRIAFLRPQDSKEHIGHVVLVSAGLTLESHGHVGPDSRNWDGQNWQANALVYIFAKNGQVAAGALTGPVIEAPAAAENFTVQTGHRYAATILLNGFEQFASNEDVAERFRQLGFTDVTVTGLGSTRHAEGTWNGVATVVPPDSHISGMHEI